MDKINNQLPLHFPSSSFTENVLQKTHCRYPKFKNFLGEHFLRLSRVWGRIRRASFSSPVSNATLPTTGIIKAYEINAQGWEKRLGLEGVGGGLHFKNCYC